MIVGKDKEVQRKVKSYNRAASYSISSKSSTKRASKIKSKSEYKNKAQTAFNKYIRLRDYNDGCISCGRSKEEVEAEQGWLVGGCWDAGHFKSRGAKGQLRFNTFNCHKQCKKCNGGSGKFAKKSETVSHAFEKNLVKKLNQEIVDRLNSNQERERDDIEYLQRIERVFAKRFKHLEKLRGY